MSLAWSSAESSAALAQPQAQSASAAAETTGNNLFIAHSSCLRLNFRRAIARNYGGG